MNAYVIQADQLDMDTLMQLRFGDRIKKASKVVGKRIVKTSKDVAANPDKYYNAGK